jgi:hypothetical protein
MKDGKTKKSHIYIKNYIIRKLRRSWNIVKIVPALAPTDNESIKNQRAVEVVFRGNTKHGPSVE